MVKHVGKEDFKEEITDYKGVVLVDFYAEWCGPCKMMSPVIDELSAEYKEVKFVKINVDDNQELASQFSVFSIPSFFIFKNGSVFSQAVGALSKDGLVNEIKKALS